MKILSVVDHYRKRALEIRVAGRTFTFPYDRLRLQPSADNRIVQVTPDRETGCEAFTYRLDSGEEDTIHLDAVLEVNADADYLQQMLLHTLTLEVRDALAERAIGVRAAARQLHTSPTQIYRLLDPAQSNKSLGQLVALLGMAGRDVEIVVRRRQEEGRSPDVAAMTRRTRAVKAR